MELGISDYEKMKSFYICFVIFAFVPRLLVFPGIFGERYLRTVITLCAAFAANYLVLRRLFGGDVAPTLYEACYGPVMSVWIALLISKIEKDNPGYFKDRGRRR